MQGTTPLGLSVDTYERVLSAPEGDQDVWTYGANHLNNPWNYFVFRIGCLFSGFKEKYEMEMIARGLENKKTVVQESLYVLKELMDQDCPSGNLGGQFKVSIAVGQDTIKTLIFDELPNNTGVKIYFSDDEKRFVIRKGNLLNLHKWLCARLPENNEAIIGRLYIYGENFNDSEESMSVVGTSPSASDDDVKRCLFPTVPTAHIEPCPAGTSDSVKSHELQGKLGTHRVNNKSEETWVKLAPSALQLTANGDRVAATSPKIRVLGARRLLQVKSPAEQGSPIKSEQLTPPLGSGSPNSPSCEVTIQSGSSTPATPTNPHSMSEAYMCWLQSPIEPNGRDTPLSKFKSKQRPADYPNSPTKFQATRPIPLPSTPTEISAQQNKPAAINLSQKTEAAISPGKGKADYYPDTNLGCYDMLSFPIFTIGDRVV